MTGGASAAEAEHAADLSVGSWGDAGVDVPDGRYVVFTSLETAQEIGETDLLTMQEEVWLAKRMERGSLT